MCCPIIDLENVFLPMIIHDELAEEVIDELAEESN